MEPAGLALGAIVLIKPVCKTIHETWQGFRLYGHESEKLRLRFSVQTSRIESFEKVLFERGKFKPPVPGRLIDSLPDHVCHGLAGLLCELYGLMQDYVARDRRYVLQNPPSDELVAALGDAGATSQENVAMLLALGRKGAGERQKSTDFLSKVTWVLKDKRAIEKLVVECEQYTERLGSLVELAFWPLPLFRSLSAIASLEGDADAANTGLSRGIGIRKLILEPSLASPGRSAQLLEMARTSFQQAGDKSSATIQYGRLDGKPDTWYMVEYRSYGDGPKAVGQERIIQLAGLLNTGPDADPQLKICKCEGYFHDAAQSRIGLVNKLPISTEVDPSEIVSLSSMLSSKGLRPRLLSRVRLALALIRTVRRLHIYGWLHKSLRSDNAIFPSVSSPQTANESSVNHPIGLEDPRIIGFEYSRRETDFSSVRQQHDHAQNLYRHPARWGVPTERFGKIHDLYGTFCGLAISRPFGVPGSVTFSVP